MNDKIGSKIKIRKSPNFLILIKPYIANNKLAMFIIG